MSWGSIEMRDYDLAYCATCQRSVYRRFDEKFWKHNGYHKDNGSHEIDPEDIRLSKATQREIEKEQNMTEEAGKPLCGSRGVSIRHRFAEFGNWSEWSDWSPAVDCYELEYLGEDGYLHQYEVCSPHNHGYKYEPEEEAMSDDITTAVSPEGSHSPVEPLPHPQCTSCHGFGSGVVQDAVSRLRAVVEADDGGLMHVEDDLGIVLTALEKHHDSVIS